jgi:hypothetical protein
VNVNDSVMYPRWNTFLKEIQDEIKMVSEMTKLCSNLESGNISQYNDEPE